MVLHVGDEWYFFCPLCLSLSFPFSQKYPVPKLDSNCSSFIVFFKCLPFKKPSEGLLSYYSIDLFTEEKKKKTLHTNSSIQSAKARGFLNLFVVIWSLRYSLETSSLFFKDTGKKEKWQQSVVSWSSLFWNDNLFWPEFLVEHLSNFNSTFHSPMSWRLSGLPLMHWIWALAFFQYLVKISIHINRNAIIAACGSSEVMSLFSRKFQFGIFQSDPWSNLRFSIPIGSDELSESRQGRYWMAAIFQSVQDF